MPAGRPKGQPKTGGRKKGTVNTTTKVGREFLTAFANATQEEFIKAFNQIEDPYQKCRVWTEIQTFITPKYQAIQISTDTEAKTFAEEMEEMREKKG